MTLGRGSCFAWARTASGAAVKPAAVKAPLDLVYVCGNKFLATNSTGAAVQVTYRVAGTGETGSLTLGEEPGEDPGYSETELETRERGVVELYQDTRGSKPNPMPSVEYGPCR